MLFWVYWYPHFIPILDIKEMTTFQNAQVMFTLICMPDCEVAEDLINLHSDLLCMDFKLVLNNGDYPWLTIYHSQNVELFAKCLLLIHFYTYHWSMNNFFFILITDQWTTFFLYLSLINEQLGSYLMRRPLQMYNWTTKWMMFIARVP